MTEILEHTQKYNENNDEIKDLDLESPEGKDHTRIIGRAIAGRTIQLDTRHDNSFKQSKVHEEFFD